MMPWAVQLGPASTGTVLKLLLPLLGIGVALIGARRRGLSLRDDLGFRAPRARDLAAWLAVWLLWIAASEWLIQTLALEQAHRWPSYSPLDLVLRVAAIGVAGPILEEVVTRGFALHILRRTRMGTAGAVVLTAVAWAALHWRYDAGSVALIAVDGLLFGTARVRTRSLWVPITLHVIGNLISIWQSTLGAS